MKTVVILFLSLALGVCNLYAQSVYHFKYYVNNGNAQDSYEAFFLRDDDGTGSVRVRFLNKETNEYAVVQMDIEDNYYVDKNHPSDSSIMYFVGHDPVVIKGDNNTRYIPQIYWFKQEPGADYYDPWGVTSTDDNPDAEGTFTEATLLLKEEDFTKELVSKFFTEEEGLYENLFDTASVRRGSTITEPVKLHLLIVANTEDNSIGTTCIKDKDRTLKAFTELAEYLNVQLDPVTIFGNKYNKAAVDAAIQSLQPSRNDIVVFYYSGHGFNYPNDSHQFPYLDLRSKDYMPLENNTLNIEDIYARIKKKGARLNLVLSDCCNAEPEASSNISSNVAQTRSTSMGWSMDNCQALFLDPKPVSVLSTAATKGELSAGNDNVGGIFTFNFGESLQSKMGLFNKDASWKSVLEQAQSQTVRKAAHTLCPQADEKTYKPCVQHPVYKVE